MSTATISNAMDQLVSGARASRDATFNTLDAIDRQSKSACDKLQADARQFVVANAEPLPPKGATAQRDERDSRFDPEDEWDVSPASSAQAPPPTAPQQPSAARSDEDDYPDTWLR